MMRFWRTTKISSARTSWRPSPTARSSPAFADREGRILITKDADFVDFHLLGGHPEKLLLVSTGNISNDELKTLLVPLIPDMVREFQSCRFIELTRSGLIVRG